MHKHGRTLLIVHELIRRLKLSQPQIYGLIAENRLTAGRKLKIEPFLDFFHGELKILCSRRS
jgi:predicted DNA-binding transcriptional regulator AlpA